MTLFTVLGSVLVAPLPSAAAFELYLWSCFLGFVRDCPRALLRYPGLYAVDLVKEGRRGAPLGMRSLL